MCGPRGCAAHGTSGAITWGSSGNLRGETHDDGLGGTIARFDAYRDGALLRSFTQRLDEGTRSYTLPIGAADRVKIRVCNASAPTTCNSRTYRR
ncbi:MAG: hypothetical protein GEV03_12405 [Streptosporangiales bacterium]|nr:hypothetical protein [Streptosporangiales bacterium]